MKKCSAFISINFSFIIQMKYTLEQSRVPPELILFFSYVGILFRILSRYTYILSLSSTRMYLELIRRHDGCDICQKTGHLESLSMECTFCNGTGEYTKAAESYMKLHPCQCIYLDRKNCSLCGKKCHHSTSNKPKLIIAPRP
jgi:hypothetical protein